MKKLLQFLHNLLSSLYKQEPTVHDHQTIAIRGLLEHERHVIEVVSRVKPDYTQRSVSVNIPHTASVRYSIKHRPVTKAVFEKTRVADAHLSVGHVKSKSKNRKRRK
jgi:hypothetical protein